MTDIQNTPDGLNDCGCYLIGCFGRVDHGPPVGILAGEICVLLTHSFMKPGVVLIDPVERCRVGMAAAEANLYWQIKQKLEIGLEPAGREALDRGERILSQAAPSALVGVCRVDVAVADDDRSPSARRDDDLADMLRPRGRHEQSLGLRENSIVMVTQQNSPDRLSDRRSPGFSRQNYRMSGALERGCQLARLNRLAAAFWPFQDDEDPTHLTERPGDRSQRGGTGLVPGSAKRDCSVRPARAAAVESAGIADSGRSPVRPP